MKQIASLIYFLTQKRVSAD